MLRNGALVALLIVIGIACVPAQGQSYKFAPLKGPQMTPFSINDAGDTAGQFCCGATSDGYDFPYMSYVSTASAGFNVILPPQGVSSGSFATGINNGAYVVGGYPDNSSTWHGFLFNALEGGFQTLDYPGAMSTAAFGVNDSSQVVGAFCMNNAQCAMTPFKGEHCFSYAKGTYTQIDYPGAIATACNAVNSNGDIVGIYSSPTQFKGFLYSKGVFTTIDPAPSVYSSAQGVNDSGEIVGTFIDTSNKSHGFTYQSGKFTTVDAPRGIGTELYGINNSGQVVGVVRTLKGLVTTLSGFVATPQ